MGNSGRTRRSVDKISARYYADVVLERSSIKSEGKNPAAVALGRLGGMKGGRARAASLTPEQRSEIARKAAKTRWSSKDQ
jgi:hypothetical protein